MISCWSRNSSRYNPDHLIFHCLKAAPRQRISTPWFYRDVILDSCGDLATFSATTLRNPTIAPHIRALCVDRNAVLPELPDDDWPTFDMVDRVDRDESASETEQLLRPLLPLLGGLISFTGANYDITVFPPYPQISEETLAITWATFQSLGTAVGSNLQRFGVEIISPAQIQSPLVFEPFLALRSLEWKCLVQFSLDTDPVWAVGALGNLECLSLVDYHPTFLTVLGRAELRRV